MNEEKKNELYNYILYQLVEMTENVRSKYLYNMDLRNDNPFLLFAREKEKYMALGRSIDSQLGNRLQNIIFYIARIKYGYNNVPALLFLDVNGNLVKMTKCYAESVDTEYYYSNTNPCKQYIIKSELYETEKLRKALNIKKGFENIIRTETIEYTNVGDDIITTITAAKQKTPVDLLVFENDIALTFEIKMSGNLDTKNAKANAEEVEYLKKLLSFVSQGNQSYFATCYANCSDAVNTAMAGINGQGIILNSGDFWQTILPTGNDALTYEEFIEIYQHAFREANIEGELDTLQ